MPDVAEMTEPAPIPVPGPILAEFTEADDALLFMKLKNWRNELCTVTVGINLMYAVRRVVNS